MLISIHAFGYQIPQFGHYLSTIRHYSPLFASVRHYSRLFATIRTIRDYSYYSHYSYYSRLFAIRDYSLFATIRYSGFPDNPFGNPACEFVLSVLSQLKRETLTILRQLPLLRDIKIY